jgi:serine/threonine-protein kinase
VLFEMLTGRRAFGGDDVSDVLASVLKSDPDWGALPADLPGGVRRVLKRCLEKDPRKRLRDIGEGMLQLEEALAAGADSGAGQVQSSKFEVESSAKPLWRRVLPIATAVVITAAAVLGVMRYTAPAADAPAVVQFDTVLTPPQRFAISRDGGIVAYAMIDPSRSVPGLGVRKLDQREGTLLRGAEAASQPFFSPDGESIGFVATTSSTLKKVSVLGGGPVELVAEAGGPVVGATWLDDGTMVYGVRGEGMFRVPQAGGKPASLTSPAEGEEHLWPSAIAGTSIVLFVANDEATPPQRSGQLAAVDTASGRVLKFKLPGMSPRYVAPGRIVYAASDGSLRSVPFDVRNIAITGESVPLPEVVGVKSSGAANFAVSGKGHLAFFGGGIGPGALRTLAWVDRTGRETPLAAPPRTYFYARVDPSGRRLALDVRDEELDVWIWDFTREALSRLTDKPGSDEYGLWTSDGRVVFSSSAGGRSEPFVHRPDGVGEMQQITDTAAAKLTPFPNAITLDGKQVIFRAATSGKNDLYVTTIGGDKSFKKLLATEHDELNAALSPDGRFMVFSSDLSGRPEIYVRPFPNVDDGQWPVSTAGGTEPVWFGREIFYLAPDFKMMSVPVLDMTRTLTLGKPQVLFDASKYFLGGAGRNYDMSPDGKRFIMVKDPSVGGETRSVGMTFILNWAERLNTK